MIQFNIINSMIQFLLTQAEALKEIYLPLKVDKLEKYDKCFKTEKYKN